MKVLSLIMVIAVLGLAGCETLEDMTEHEEEIPLSEVPASVLKAAQTAVDGIVLTEAEVEEEDGQIVYEIEGKANGKEYEIEVTADGEVLEVEEEDEDKD